MSLVATGAADSSDESSPVDFILVTQTGPGDSPERMSWTLSIDATGRLRQSVILPPDLDSLEFTQSDEEATLSSVERDELFSYPDRIGFDGFPPRLRSTRVVWRARTIPAAIAPVARFHAGFGDVEDAVHRDLRSIAAATA